MKEQVRLYEIKVNKNLKYTCLKARLCCVVSLYTYIHAHTLNSKLSLFCYRFYYKHNVVYSKNWWLLKILDQWESKGFCSHKF